MINYYEIVKVNEISYFTKYIIYPEDFSIVIYDNAKHEELQELTYINTITTLLFNASYSIDFDKSEIIFSQDLKDKYVKIKYKTKGEENPFYISGNLYKFLSSIFKNSLNNISSGMYIYQYEYDENYIWRLSHGDFTYNGNYYVCKEQLLNLKTMAPPTQTNFCKCYYFFVNEEILESYLDKQTNILQEVGIITSYMFEDFSSAKLDALGKYSAQYSSNALTIAFMWVLTNTQNNTYDVWIEYDNEIRKII